MLVMGGAASELCDAAPSRLELTNIVALSSPSQCFQHLTVRTGAPINSAKAIHASHYLIGNMIK